MALQAELKASLRHILSTSGPARAAGVGLPRDWRGAKTALGAPLESSAVHPTSGALQVSRDRCSASIFSRSTFAGQEVNKHF